ncbi:Hypp6951 [Branchiostoma lanceolatum]|uniref:Hypp6951 protein n=1 Tax=Branchiostoma lanceolatum TaxID=7740 RepID=A0A8J9YVR4_BRALA|nr:Hypp6951 [Branchiostoma lanceolatum]
MAQRPRRQDGQPRQQPPVPAPLAALPGLRQVGMPPQPQAGPPIAAPQAAAAPPAALQGQGLVPPAAGQVPVPPAVGQVPVPPAAPHGQVPVPPAVQGQVPVPPAVQGQVPVPPAVQGQVPPVPPAVQGQVPVPPAVQGQVPVPPAVQGQVPPVPLAVPQGQVSVPPPAEGGNVQQESFLRRLEVLETAYRADGVRETLERVLDLARAPSELNRALLIPALRRLEEKARIAGHADLPTYAATFRHASLHEMNPMLGEMVLSSLGSEVDERVGSKFAKVQKQSSVYTTRQPTVQPSPNPWFPEPDTGFHGYCYKCGEWGHSQRRCQGSRGGSRGFRPFRRGRGFRK